MADADRNLEMRLAIQLEDMADVALTGDGVATTMHIVLCAKGANGVVRTILRFATEIQKFASFVTRIFGYRIMASAIKESA